MQLENRIKDIDLITPDRDIRLLNIKYNDLENSKGAQPNLKQNVAPLVNTFYTQEGKYLSERSDLYRTPVYNPYALKQHIESVKAEPKISTNYTSGSGWPSRANFSMPDDTYEHRPKLLAHKVFDDYENKKRVPLENVLVDPLALTTDKLQENGFILKQSTYGDSYNTKKFLQENETLKKAGELVFQQIDQSELEKQNVTLKSYNDQPSNDSKLEQYPRLSGPIPPEPYERIYCNEEIGEMTDGYSKRYYSRIYDSPNVKPHAKYEPLRSDLNAIAQYEAKSAKEQEEYKEYLNSMRNDVIQKSIGNEITYTNPDKAARRITDPTAKQVIEQVPISTYRSNYSPYKVESTVACPPNEFYKNIDYTEMSPEDKPNNIIELQDQWTKSLAHKRYHSAYPLQGADLRENITEGKKIIYTAPPNAYKFAILKN